MSYETENERITWSQGNEEMVPRRLDKQRERPEPGGA